MIKKIVYAAFFTAFAASIIVGGILDTNLLGVVDQNIFTLQMQYRH
ncbi:hypothetical protein [Priestia filamentosa]|nr:hypothetical protein [Priestia filamentosa]MDT3765314.1 hypothetical protein [Priestia filamentosa]WRU95812.1 hypothetical protein RYX51_01605 [Priestia filamentosa]SMF51655.1 hypothetical protein SAMN06296056_10475 [Priestia filamentosa]